VARPLSNILGIDDAPFSRHHRGDVPIAGVVYAKDRLDGVLVSKVRRDGANGTQAVASMLERSRFRDHCRGVLLQGIALAGFNVVDIHGLSERLGLPVLVVARRKPDMRAIRAALETWVPGGSRKWELIQRAGPMERLGRVWVQRAGLGLAQAEETLKLHTRHGVLPEPIRVAHLVAGAVGEGESRGRP
jgi:hypothetical protein